MATVAQLQRRASDRGFAVEGVDPFDLKVDSHRYTYLHECDRRAWVLTSVSRRLEVSNIMTAMLSLG